MSGFAAFLHSRPFTAIASALSATLAVTLLPAQVAAETPRAAGLDKVQTVSTPQERPDAVSAMVTARATGKKVEDLSQRDELTRVFANPDGTWSSETASEPERVQDEAGVWHDIDTTLVPRDGGVAPAHAATDVVFSGGGDHVFASMTTKGQKLDWRWPTALPKPTIEGATATYADVLPAADLVVTADGTGFTHSVLLHEAPSRPVRFTIPVVTRGAGLTKNAQGGLEIRSKAGKTLVSSPRPLMWDASENAGGVSEHVAPVDLSVGKSPNGTPTFTLSPDEEFLSDPETVYPVTVDPSFTTYTNGDAWLENPNYTTGQTSSPELRVGTYDGGTHVARAFMHFDTTKWDDKHVTSAKLVLRNYYSGSCTGGVIQARRIQESWNGNTMTWANKPPGGTGYMAEYSRAHGYNSSCGADDAVWTITGMVQDWADGNFTNNGIMLRAENENSIYTWRRYRSANYGTESVRPHIDVTYNSYPNKAGTPSVTPGNSGYSTSTTPTLKATVSDPDGGELRAKFTVYNSGGAAVWTGYSCTSIANATCTANGGTASTTVPSSAGLANGSTYTVKAWAEDGTGDQSKTASAATSFKVDGVAPDAPGVSSSAYTNNAWTETVPSSNTFGFDGVADTGSFSYQKDTGNWTTLGANSSGDASLSWAPTSGFHTLKVKAIDRAGNPGPISTFSFGVAGLSFSAPTTGAKSTSHFPLALKGRPDSTGGQLSWRYAGKSAWTPMTGVMTASGSPWTGTVPNNSDGTAAELNGLVWDASAQEDPATGDLLEAPAVLEIRGCFAYVVGDPELCSSAHRVQLVPHAFGGNFPVTTVGPATVALFTGELSITETDAAAAGVGAGRVFSSYAEATLSANSPFGPGWSSDFSADLTSAAAATVLDQRTELKTFTLQYPSGETASFVQEGTGTNFVYQPADGEDPDTQVLVLTATDTLELREEMGPTTVWRLHNGNWELEQVTGPIRSGTTRFERDGDNRLVWLAQTAIDGVVCNKDVQSAGCRGLMIDYTGDRVTSLRKVGFDPKTQEDGLPGPGAGMAPPQTIATFDYDAQGQLVKVTDPRTGLSTEYTYDSVAGRTVLSSLKPPAQLPWQFTYDPADARLTTVKRALPDETGHATWTVVYDLATDALGLPTMSAAEVARWGQETVPSNVSAVFEPSRVPNAVPTAADLEYAALWYFTEDGTVTNTAVRGSGEWLVDANWYDDEGRITQILPAAARSKALQAEDAAKALQVATEGSALTIYDEADRVREEFGPAHTAVLDDGSSQRIRPHTVYVYDNEAPELAIGRPALPEGETGFDLVVEERHSAYLLATGEESDVRLVRYEYAPQVVGDASGWDLGTPTRTKTQTGAGTWSSTVSRLDQQGREIETRQAGGATNPDGSGADPRSRSTVYYTADDSSPVNDCDNHPEWEGLVCLTGPTEQPTSGPELPVTWTLAYSRELAPTRVEERSGTNPQETRVTVAQYDAAGRVQKSTKQLGDSILTNEVRYGVHGLPEDVVSGDGTSVSSSYDQWGREATYTDAFGTTTTTTFRPDGEPATVDAAGSSYTFGYGADGERRAVPTSVEVAIDGNVQAFDLRYDSAGQLSEATYPNGMKAHRTYDERGLLTDLVYSQAGTEVIGFSAERNMLGAVRHASSTASSQSYSYDKLNRLTMVEETLGDVCLTRIYEFSPSSNRTGLSNYGPGGDGASCQHDILSSSEQSNFDEADRLIAAGYSYDSFGRTLTTPREDTASGAMTDLVAAYHANDMVATLSQTMENGQGGSVTESRAYGLDPTGRINTVRGEEGGVETSRLRYRFASEVDTPTIVDESTDGGATWASTRYVTIPGLGMAAVVAGGVTTLQLANPHGDIVATASGVPGTASIDSYSETDEYGNRSGGTSSRYGWLGAFQRSHDTIGGLTLMGARLYNPATGLFLSVDSVVGGGVNPYSYSPDPINTYDLDGKCLFGIILLCHFEVDVDIPGDGYYYVRRTPHEIGRHAENIAINWIRVFYGLYREEIHRGPSGRNRVRVGRARELRIYDISAYIYGKLTYFEIKANKSPYTDRQRRLDRIWGRRHPVIFWRIKGIPIWKRQSYPAGSDYIA